MQRTFSGKIGRNAAEIEEEESGFLCVQKGRPDNSFVYLAFLRRHAVAIPVYPAFPSGDECRCVEQISIVRPGQENFKVFFIPSGEHEAARSGEGPIDSIKLFAVFIGARQRNPYGSGDISDISPGSRLHVGQKLVLRFIKRQHQGLLANDRAGGNMGFVCS